MIESRDGVLGTEYGLANGFGEAGLLLTVELLLLVCALLLSAFACATCMARAWLAVEDRRAALSAASFSAMGDMACAPSNWPVTLRRRRLPPLRFITLTFGASFVVDVRSVRPGDTAPLALPGEA